MLQSKYIMKKTLAVLALGFAVLTSASSYRVLAQTGNPFASSTVAKLDAKPAASTSTVGSSSALPAPPPSSNWTGFYVGGFAGANFGRATANTSAVVGNYFANTSVVAISTTGTQKLTPNGFNGGVEAGYNHQSGNFVVGAEADFGSLTGSKTATGTTTYPCCPGTAFTITQSVKTNWLFTARPRAGFTAGSALFYVTGGVAVTNINYQERFTDTFAAATESGAIKKTRAGYTAGGGIEYKVGSKWSIKGEYLYADFRRVSTTSTNLTTTGGPSPTAVFTHSIYLKEHVVRFGINYHF